MRSTATRYGLPPLIPKTPRPTPWLQLTGVDLRDIVRSTLLVPFAVFDDHVHSLQEINITQHVAFHGDDIGEFTFAN